MLRKFLIKPFHRQRVWTSFLGFVSLVSFGLAVHIGYLLKIDHDRLVDWQRVDASITHISNHTQPSVLFGVKRTDDLFFEYTYSYDFAEYNGSYRLEGVDAEEFNYHELGYTCMTSGVEGLLWRILDEDGVSCDVEMAPALATLTTPFAVYVNPKNPSESTVVGLRTTHDKFFARFFWLDVIVLLLVAVLFLAIALQMNASIVGKKKIEVKVE